ncbi:heavy-metal-associated domain-containing protein [Pedobacter sp. PLR]|uniref:heavy-metal-associated domain-containing protein n=1 Tax=Pedobacter sp. PLR TaxID=2994465 RepID=UPI0022452F95|nr:heavy-metal-associated domain-containing protein [Pedobacter sp. PLR]MCX2452914.1 heavy-metal-associated domain-containing protein [Pedobacter sp. PLR]
MNIIKNLIILSIVLIAGKASAQQITTAELQVTGLTCSMCSQATEKSLRTLDFVDAIEPDLNKNLFAITFKKDKAVNIDQIRKKVEDAGFSVGNLTAVFNFNNTKVDDKGLATAGANVYQFLNQKSQTLNGPVTATVVDKNFISGSAFKKKAAQLKSEAYASGSGLVNGKKTRIYHLSI